jgi:hypothetical protein
VIGTYAAALAIVVGSTAVGQAAISLCGGRRWSWLAPAVGLALLVAICWATVRLPGEGSASMALVTLVVLAAGTLAWRRTEDGRGAVVAGLPVALIAAGVASLPFWVEGHFGILGTGFNPDMSQHLLAGDRLASGADGQLLNQGYPLGPHAVAVTLSAGQGIDLVQAFSGLTLAIAVIAPLTALAVFRDERIDRRLPPALAIGAALLTGLPYLVASYYAQGAFKETMQALFLLAFVLALREGDGPDRRGATLRFVPPALIAIGSVYAYSFPGLLWLGGALVLWLAINRELPVRPLLLGTAVFLVGVLPELGRMIDFQRFETFDPSGPGLGNLFGQISPLEALGIWPSGGFRLAPGDGAAPAVAYYLGAAFAAALFVLGLARCWRHGESAVVAGLGAAAGLYVAARIGGTPYTAAKALGIAAPLVTLAILSSAGGAVAGVPHSGGRRRRPSTWGRAAAIGPAAGRLVLTVYIAAAGACSLLAFANAPVGPTAYSPALTALRPLLAADSTLVLAPDRLLDEEHGARYIAWELRGGRVCIEPASTAGGAPPPGVRFVLSVDVGAQAPFPGLSLRRRAGPYLLWERPGIERQASPCPLIAVRQVRQGAVR